MLPVTQVIIRHFFLPLFSFHRRKNIPTMNQPYHNPKQNKRPDNYCCTCLDALTA